MNDAEFQVLKKLMYGKDLPIEKLSKEEQNTAKNLITQGIAKEHNNLLNLTAEGLHLLSTLDGVSLKQKKKPLVCCFVICKDNDKFLVNKRLKQPFINHLGVPGGKLDMGNDPLNQAKEELLDETGLKGDFELKIISNNVTYEENELTHHVLAFIYLVTNTKGELIKNHREGENFWIKESELTKYKMFPDLPRLIEDVQKDELTQLNLTRYVENGEFVKIKFH